MAVLILIVKILILFAIVEAAIGLLSRYREGDSSERTNHRRGWWLVAILTLAAVGLAWV